MFHSAAHSIVTDFQWHMERSQDDIMNSSDGARESQGKQHTVPRPTHAQPASCPAQATCCVDTAFDVFNVPFNKQRDMSHGIQLIVWDN